MSKKISEAELIGYFNEHVLYELLMLRFSKQCLESSRHELVWNAMFAAFNVSARNLYNFLGRRERKENMNVADYQEYRQTFDRPNVEAVKSVLGDLNAQCLHLGKERSSQPDEKINLDGIKVMSEWVESHMAILMKSFKGDFQTKLTPERADIPDSSQVQTTFGPIGPSQSSWPLIVKTGPTGPAAPIGHTGAGQGLHFNVASKE